MSVSRRGYPGLPVADQLAILAVAVVQFLVGHGRIWNRPFDWDRSILWSYATISLLVLLDLAIRRRLHFLGWFLHTLELSAAKFVLTAGFLVAFLTRTLRFPSPPGNRPRSQQAIHEPLRLGEI